MRPLEGVRVVSIEQFGAAPYGSMLLADLGAEVIKVENPDAGGDAARSGGPYPLGSNDSLYFQGWNTNKKSVTLDLKCEDDRARLLRLVEDADAVVNNLRGDLPGKLGLDYAALSSVNPAVVCGHISAYGRDNERSKRPGYDFLMQAEAGLMSLTGDPDGPPSRFGPSIIDFMTGTMLAVGLLACVMQARRSGTGCDVDASLFDVALHQLNYSATWYLNQNHVAKRMPRSAHFSSTPVQMYRASDGWVFVMCMTDKFWKLLISAVGRGDLLEDERFETMAARASNRDELTGVLDEVFSRKTMREWEEQLGSIIPIAPVYDIQRALESPFVARTGMVNNVPHPQMQGLRLLSNPLKINGERPRQQVCAPLGGNNDELIGGR